MVASRTPGLNARSGSVRARDGPLRLQPAHDCQPPAIALLHAPVPERCGAERQRDVELSPTSQARERRRRYADDGAGRPRRASACPIALSRPPNHDCQNLWLITAAASHPLHCRQALSRRPLTGTTPRVPKKSAPTHKRRARCDSARRARRKTRRHPTRAASRTRSGSRESVPTACGN